MAEAWVTLATNDTYALGALVLAECLKRVGTTKQLHIMITKDVTQPIREFLQRYYNAVTTVDMVDSQDEAHLTLLARPDLGCTLTKLHCWTLTQYKKGVFIDADAIILKNPDELFDYPELSAVPDVGWPDTFNSGVFVFVPSLETFHGLLNTATTQGSYDGGDQGLLNTYFKDWFSKGPSHRLSFIYNMNSAAAYTYLAAYKQFGHNVKIVHFLGAVKPWHQQYDPQTRQLRLRPDNLTRMEHIEHWWHVFHESIAPHLTPDFSRETTLGTTCVPLPHMVEVFLTFTTDEAGADLGFEAVVEPVAEPVVHVPIPSLESVPEPKIERLTFPLPVWLNQGGEGQVVSGPLPFWRQPSFESFMHVDCPICTGETPLPVSDVAVVEKQEMAAKEELSFSPAAAANDLTAWQGKMRAVPVGGNSNGGNNKQLAQSQGVGGQEHQQAWERGNIDYLGKDSWENIQKKLDQSTSK